MGCNECLRDTIGFFIELLALTEAIYTTIAFDQEKFGFYYIAMVFMFFPMVESIFKLIAYCTLPTWDDILVDVTMEVAQAFLYLYFCSFEKTAMLILLTIMGIQIFFWIILWCIKRDDDWKTSEQIAIRSYFCCVSNCSNIFVNIFGFLNLLMQINSPFRSLSYEIILAVGAWIANLNVSYMGSELEEVIDDVSEMNEMVQFYLSGNRKGVVGFVNFITSIWVIGITLYNSCLSWIWYYSPEIYQTFDKVMSMINMVSSVIALAGYLCRAMCPNFGQQATGAPEQPFSCCKLIFALLMIGVTIGVPLGVLNGRSDLSVALAIANREGFDYAWPLSKGMLLAEKDSLGKLPFTKYTVKNFERCATRCGDLESDGGSFFAELEFDNCICNQIISCVEPTTTSSSDNDEEVTFIDDDGISSSDLSKGFVFSSIPRPKECIFTFCDYFPSDTTCTDANELPAACNYNTMHCEWKDLGSPIIGEGSGDRAGFSVSISDNGKVLVVGSPANDNEAEDGGTLSVYTWTGSSWTERGYGISGLQEKMWFGITVKVSGDGNTIAAAASGEDFTNAKETNNGRIYTWRWNGEEFENLGSAIMGNDRDNIGGSIALSYDGNVLTFGANDNDGHYSTRRGVEAYYWSGSVWRQRGSTIPIKTFFNETGLSVAMTPDGNTLAIGDYYNDDNGWNSGYVSVYDWNGGCLWELRHDGIFGESVGGALGKSVALSDDGKTLVAGAPYYGAGSVYTFIDRNDKWEQVDKLEGTLLNDSFGYSLSLSANGKTVAVGATGVDRFGTSENDEGNHGQTKIFDRRPPSSSVTSTSLWKQRGTDINGRSMEDWNGGSVSLSARGDIVAIGESGYDAVGKGLAGRAVVLQWGHD